MAARRALLVAAGFLLALAIVSAMSPRERAEQATKPSPTPVVEPAAETTGTLPGDRVVRARVGDVVRIDFQVDDTDTAEIVELGLEALVTPDVPSELTFVAERVGRFDVTLRVAERSIGTVVVKEASG